VSTDDEAFTYNKRISRIAPIQEHRMILKAIERGVSGGKDRGGTGSQSAQHPSQGQAARRHLKKPWRS
jgi:hypothetical protein